MAESKRLQQLDEQMAEIKRRVAAEKKRIRQQERKDEDRRRMTAGKIVLAHAETDEGFRAVLDALLVRHVEERDRPLFPDLFGSDDDSGEESAEPDETPKDAAARARRRMQEIAAGNAEDRASVMAFHEAYTELGGGSDFVRIHRLRERLGWDAQHFDDMLASLAAAYTIELHGGDPAQLTPDELHGSYTGKDGQQFITLSWRKW